MLNSNQAPTIVDNKATVNIDNTPALVVTEAENISPLIDAVDANTTYFGYAPSGSLPTDRVWMICKVVMNCTVNNDGTLTAIGSGTQTWTGYPSANATTAGSKDFSYSWSNRTNLTYGR